MRVFKEQTFNEYLISALNTEGLLTDLNEESKGGVPLYVVLYCRKMGIEFASVILFYF